MLKAFLSSDTVLSDAFLTNEPDGKAAHATAKPSINRKLPPSDQDSAGSFPESKIKIFYDTYKKKVMYAECKHDFVDLLLGFLTYPLGCVIKNMYYNGVTSPLINGGGFDNLYISVVELDAAGFITKWEAQ